MPVPRNHGRVTTNRGAGRDVAKDATANRHTRTVANCEVIAYYNAAADNNKIPECGAAGDADMASQNARVTERHVVRDFDPTIDLALRANPRIAQCATIYRAPRTNLDVVANQDAAQLWHTQITERPFYKAKPGLSNGHV
jgi:hypothetical protein